jgi:hypothetical protein
MLRPEVSSARAFPDFYSINAVMASIEARTGNELPIAAPILPDNKLGSFRLREHFDLKKPGRYQLTVWPKLYRRTEVGGDIVWRVDLPPVTAVFDWGGKWTP